MNIHKIVLKIIEKSSKINKIGQKLKKIEKLKNRRKMIPTMKKVAQNHQKLDKYLARYKDEKRRKLIQIHKKLLKMNKNWPSLRNKLLKNIKNQVKSSKHWNKQRKNVEKLMKTDEKWPE